MFGGWFGGKKSSPNSSVQSIDPQSELEDLLHAIEGAELILNDDVDGAEEGLSGRNSAFHMLGKAVVMFIRATLGFEQDIMRQAADRLNDAENKAYSDQQRAKSNLQSSDIYRSEIYAPGTEFVLCQAMAQLMCAVVGVLNESLTESIKGFYKLRKAYFALDAVLKMEEKFMQSRQAGAKNTPSPTPSLKEPAEVDAVDAPEDLSKLHLADPGHGAVSSRTSTSEMINHDPDSDIFKNPIDVFVHSGASFCFGVLLLLISMVPPAFARLLSIVGFHGNKDRALKLLWQSSKFENLPGAIAALTLLGYYNAFVRYCDIMPDSVPGKDGDIQGYPRGRLEALLTRMRERFPKSQLWLLEESRMNGANKRLDVALDLLCTKEHSPLKQVEALKVFEKSLNAMYLHKYEQCADAFIECADLNSWSRSLYYYIAATCHISLYREFAGTDPEKATAHAERAVKLLHKAPRFAGTKKFMARQLPFDIFVVRKIAKWEARAKEWNVPLVDAVGVDPIEEMIFFWNGHSRMTHEQLEDSLTRLSWSESDANKTWSREGPEEKGIYQVLRAAVLRSMRRHEEAKDIIRASIFTLDRSVFKGRHKDDWVYPVAHFEMAANLWMGRPTYVAQHGGPVPKASDSENSGTPEKELVRECKENLQKAARWESYEQEARFGLKVTAALEAVAKWEDQNSTKIEG
ncbi:TTC39/IML2 family protein [Aspergillus lucknowensis]|uniref:Inclusion body clearance protein IML2 n=1 Tax=Aspergillus lucknowensis TaxID=176173 RepID=A0ABR4M643_9EURO